VTTRGNGIGYLTITRNRLLPPRPHRTRQGGRDAVRQDRTGGTPSIATGLVA